jgi:uncharacterized protein (DUF2147 family)
MATPIGQRGRYVPNYERTMVMISIYRLALRAVVAIFCAFIAASAYADPPTIEGVWQQIDNGTGYVGGLISFKEKAGSWEGYIVKMYPKPGDPVDPACAGCTDDRKDQPVLGLRLIQNAKRDGLSYEGGTILDPRNGSQYSVQLMLAPDNQTLTVRGYVGLTLFGQSQTWKRLSETDPEYPKPPPRQQIHAAPKKDHSAPKPVQGQGDGP